MSSAMTEVAVRLAEPDRSAEQSAASLGQAVRRQVSFMNEAISRALGRAGELEALVHNEVAALEKSYRENEHKIKGLIQELVGERHALVSTTDKVSETLEAMGGEVPSLIENLSQQQIKLAKIIEGAGQNLIALENKLVDRQRQPRNQRLPIAPSSCRRCSTTIRSRSMPRWPTVPKRSTCSWCERTRALDAAFSERLALFDDSMLRSAVPPSTTRSARRPARLSIRHGEPRARALSDTLGRQATDNSTNRC